MIIICPNPLFKNLIYLMKLPNDTNNKINMETSLGIMNNAFVSAKSLYDQNITTAIAHLIDLEYNFTINDFDNFIRLATMGTTKSYMTSPLNTPHNDQDKVIKYMLSKFTLSNDQFYKLVKCIKIRTDNPYNLWMDTLIEKGYKFTDDQIEILKLRKYNVTNLVRKGVSVDVTDIMNEIIDILNNNKQMIALTNILNLHTDPYPDNFMEIFLGKIREYSFWGPALKKFKKTIKQIIDILTTKGIKFTEQCNSAIISITTYYTPFKSDIVRHILNKGFNPNILLLDQFSKIGNFSLVFYGVKKHDLNTAIMNSILSHCFYNNATDISEVKMNKLKTKLIENGYDNQKILNMLRNQYSRSDMYDLFIEWGIKPDDKTFEIACKFNDYKIFRHCIDEFNLIPSKKHLELAFSCANDENYNIQKLDYNVAMITDILQYKVVPTPIEFNYMVQSNKVQIWEKSKWSLELFNLLVKYGLKITIVDIEYALANNIYIDGLERFGIGYNDQLYYLCHINNFFPIEYMSKFVIDKNILELRSLCRKQTTIDKIMTFMKKNNVKLDRYCMEHAARYNPKMLLHMIEELELEPTLSLFYWSNQISKNEYQREIQKKCYKKFIEKHKITNDYLKQQFIY